MSPDPMSSAASPTLFCTRCGAATSAEAQFCSNCGASLPGVTATAAASAPVYTAPDTTLAAALAPVRYAGFWLRFLAAIIDAILVNIVLWPILMALGGGLGVAGDAARLPVFGVQLIAGSAGFALGVVAKWLYEALMVSSSRQATIGKMAIGLQVTDEYGAPISFGRASGRFFAKYVSMLTLFIGYIMAGFTARKQALHDMIAGTLVVRR